MKDNKNDLQLPSSLACAICFEHRIHSPDVTLDGVVIDSEPHLIPGPESNVQNKLLVCSLGCQCSHWLFGFSVLHSNKTVYTIKIKYKINLSYNYFLIIIYNEM